MRKLEIQGAMCPSFHHLKKHLFVPKKILVRKQISPNGHAHWISGKMLSGKMVRHIVVQPKLSILGFGICICIWDLYLAKWTCPLDFWRKFEWKNGMTLCCTT